MASKHWLFQYVVLLSLASAADNIEAVAISYTEQHGSAKS